MGYGVARHSNRIECNFYYSSRGFASFGPAGNDTFATYQSTVLQYFLHIVIFGKTVIVSPLKVEAIKGAKDMVISNKAGKEAALGQAA